MKFVRTCDVTSKGMNDGWVWYDGVFYTSTKEITLEELRKDIRLGHLCNDIEFSKEFKELSQDDDWLLQWGFDNDIFYYTEWSEDDAYCDENFKPQFFDENGALILNIQ